MVTESVAISRELYLAILLDRQTCRPVIIVSTEGGMDIEEVAHRTPDKIIKVFFNPLVGLTDAQAQQLATGIGVPPASLPQAVDVLKKLYRCYMDTDASLAEINPLILEGNGHIKALDAKFNFDANALFRHPEIVAYRDLDEEDPAEIEASKFDLSYISLDGNIGCLVNGAGLAMATMDTIKLFGGEPANFLDVGGGATAEKVTEAFKIMLANKNVKGILVNIFGGIMRCDTIAEGVIAACKAVHLSVPLVVRMKGTNEDIGKKLLAESGLPIISANTMAEAATAIVAAVK
jgi:succinyl-CoA synthetase beta subunit